MNRERFEAIDQLWVPCFRVGSKDATASALEGLCLDKETGEQITAASQSSEVELYAVPPSDGTPVMHVDFPATASTKVISQSFVFIANQLGLDESLEMPLLLAHVDKQAHWKVV